MGFQEDLSIGQTAGGESNFTPTIKVKAVLKRIFLNFFTCFVDLVSEITTSFV